MTHLMQIEPIQPSIGAIVRGIDLSEDLDGQTISQIYLALLKYKVIFFLNQDIDVGAQIRFARYFGDVEGQPGPINHASSSVQKIAAVTDRHVHTWHSDTSWSRTPPMGAILRAVDIPPVGGDTIWANGEAAFDGLSSSAKRAVAGLYVFHDNQADLVRKGISHPTIRHPLVRTHPDTKRPALWPSYNVGMRIDGLTAQNSDTLLKELHFEITRPEYQVRFRWSNAAVAFWDNRCTVHYAVKDYGDYPRLMERVLVNRGEVPFFDGDVTNTE